MADVAYCSRENVFAVFPAAALSSLDPANVIDPAIRGEAAQWIDPALRAAYPRLGGSAPGWQAFDSWDDSLRRCNAVLAATAILRQRGTNPAAADETLHSMRKEQLDFLDAVANGKRTVNVTPRAHQVTGYDQPAVSTGERRGW